DAGAMHSSFLGGLPRVAFAFAAGIGFHRIWRTYDLRLTFAPFWAPALLLIGVFAIQPGDLRPIVDVLIVVFVFPIILWLGASARPQGWTASACKSLGDTSYALYALHSPLLIAAGILWVQWDLGNVREMSWAPSFALALGIIAIAYAAHTFYDAPLRQALTRAARRRATHSTELAQAREG
ncbi:MAG: acyltransferase family protein, partial [Hyphomonadaceae bacterium]